MTGKYVGKKVRGADTGFEAPSPKWFKWVEELTSSSVPDERCQT
jgi:hypothetical protein